MLRRFRIAKATVRQHERHVVAPGLVSWKGVLRGCHISSHSIVMKIAIDTCLEFAGTHTLIKG
jgi:hypothetical protein